MMDKCPIEIVDNDHKVERLYIHWDILSICNYRCYYCYANHYFNKTFIYSLQHVKYILEKCILKAKYPVFVGLQGGEPTLHPEYGNIISYIYETLFASHPLNKMYITTNLSKPLSFFKQIHTQKYDRCMMLISLHPQYCLPQLPKLVDYIDFFSDVFQKTRINIMMPDNERFYDTYHKIYDILLPLKSSYNNLEIHPHFVYYEAMNKLYPYTKRFYDEFSYLKNIDPYIKVTYKDGTHEILNDLEYFRRKINTCVTGMRCYHNNYEIVSDFKVFNLCFRNLNADLKENPDFFKTVTIQPRVCTHKSCNCDGLIKILKRRGNEFPYNTA